MGSEKTDSARPAAALQPEDWRHLAGVGGVAAAIVGGLMLGGLMQVDDAARPESTAVTADSAPASRPPVPVAPVRVAAAPPRPQPQVNTDPLDERAARDRDRIAQSRERWTLQFLFACDERSVRSKLASLRGERELYLLPQTHDGRACYRLCWGLYDSRDNAARATGFPDVVAAWTDRPRPIAVAELTR